MVSALEKHACCRVAGKNKCSKYYSIAVLTCIDNDDSSTTNTFIQFCINFTVFVCNIFLKVCNIRKAPELEI